MVCLFFISVCVVELIIYELYSIEKSSQDKINDRVRAEFISISDEENDTEYDDEEDFYDDEYSIKSPEQIKGDYTKFIFVGDSRYKGMERFASEEDLFIAESGRGFDFLLEQLSNIKYNSDGNTAIIVGLGVNDNLKTSAGDYINTLYELQNSVEAQVYFMLVNPVDEAKEEYNGYNVTNEAIDAFNQTIKNCMDESIGIIDSNSYLKELGYDTQDGLHYVDATYEDIYNYIKADITRGLSN